MILKFEIDNRKFEENSNANFQLFQQKSLTFEHCGFVCFWYKRVSGIFMFVKWFFLKVFDWT